MEPAHVIAARAQLGREFRHRGRGPAYFDCIGLLVAAFAATGILLQDRRAYGREPVHDGLEAELLRQFGPPVTEIRPGDVGAFRFEGAVHHVGIFGQHPLGGLSLIHTHATLGRVVECRFAGSAWERRLACAFRHPEAC